MGAARLYPTLLKDVMSSVKLGPWQRIVQILQSTVSVACRRNPCTFSGFVLETELGVDQVSPLRMLFSPKTNLVKNT